MTLHHRLNEEEARETQTLCGVRYNPVTDKYHTSVYYRDQENLHDVVDEWTNEGAITLIRIQACQVCIGNPKLDLAILADTPL